MSHIETERDGGVGIITIARRARFNAMDVATARDFRRAGLRFARDREIRAVVIRGDGGVFSSGADLKYIRDGGDGDVAYLRAPAEGTGYGRVFKQILEYLHATISEIRRAPKPFVAAVDGSAAAGGLGIAMACDLVWASERATFEWAYFKTGLSGAESTTFFLPRLVGFRRAMDFVLGGQRLDAFAARDLGLVSSVFATDGFDGAVRERARELAALPTAAVAMAKELLNHAMSVERLDAHLDLELASLARVADGRDFDEGMRAFFEKRPARFTGEG